VAQTKLPTPHDTPASFYVDQDDFILTVKTQNERFSSNDASLSTVEILPAAWGLVDNTARARAQIEDSTLIIRQTRGDRDLSDLKTTQIVIAYEAADGIRESFSLSAHTGNGPVSGDFLTSSDLRHFGDITLEKALLFALLGGLILNLMHCVFPVLSMKALSLVKIADKQPALARAHGLAYTVGVVVSFLVIAAVLVTLKTAGYSAGWGFQLQNPIVVSVLAYILFLVGLNLTGYFDIGGHVGHVGQKLTQGRG